MTNHFPYLIRIGMARITRKEDKANCLSLGELCSSQLVIIENKHYIFSVPPVYIPLEWAFPWW
jgi:hypothetical protein